MSSELVVAEQMPAFGVTVIKLSILISRRRNTFRKFFFTELAFGPRVAVSVRLRLGYASMDKLIMALVRFRIDITSPGLPSTRLSSMASHANVLAHSIQLSGGIDELPNLFQRTILVQ